MSEDRIGDLEKKVDSLEYKQIEPLKKDINEIKINLAENNILTKQAIETSDKLSETMDTVRLAMVEITQSLKNSNNISGELAENVKALSNQVVVLDNKVDNKFKEIDKKVMDVNDKSKVDIVEWLKNNAIGISVIVGGLIYFVIKLCI